MTMRSFDGFLDDIALGLMWLFGPWPEHTEPVSWSVDGPIDLVRVHAISGPIVVRGGDQDVVMVRATKTVRGPTEELANLTGWLRFASRVEVRMTPRTVAYHRKRNTSMPTCKGVADALRMAAV